MWTRGEAAEGEAALQQLMACRTFLPPAHHFAQQKGGATWEEAAESFRDYFVRFSYLQALETAAEVAAARSVLTDGGGRGGRGGNGAPPPRRAAAGGAPGAEESTAGRNVIYESLRMKRAQVRVSLASPNPNPNPNANPNRVRLGEPN